MSIRRILIVSLVGIMFGMITNACAGPPDFRGELGGCEENIRGTVAVIRPETSSLRCTAIKQLIFGIPSEPQVYSIRGNSPRMSWKCRFYGVRDRVLILRCQHHERQFSVVNSRS